MGRMIDANRLLLKFKEKSNNPNYRMNMHNIWSYINTAPTVEERKQGEWDRGYSFPDGQYVKCSCCDELIKCTYPMNYCPNCGADMREESNYEKENECI